MTDRGRSTSEGFDFEDEVVSNTTDSDDELNNTQPPAPATHVPVPTSRHSRPSRDEALEIKNRPVVARRGGSSTNRAPSVAMRADLDSIAKLGALMPTATSRHSTVATRLRAESIQTRYNPKGPIPYPSSELPPQRRLTSVSRHVDPSSPAPRRQSKPRQAAPRPEAAAVTEAGSGSASSGTAVRTLPLRASSSRTSSPSISAASSNFKRQHYNHIKGEGNDESTPRQHTTLPPQIWGAVLRGEIDARPTLSPRTFSTSRTASAAPTIGGRKATVPQRHAIVHNHWHANEAYRKASATTSRSGSVHSHAHTPTPRCPGDLPSYKPVEQDGSDVAIREVDAVCLRSEVAPLGTLPTQSPFLRYEYPNPNSSSSDATVDKISSSQQRSRSAQKSNNISTANKKGSDGGGRKEIAIEQDEDEPAATDSSAFLNPARRVVVLHAADSRLPAPVISDEEDEEGGEGGKQRTPRGPQHYYNALIREDNRHLYRQSPADLSEALDPILSPSPSSHTHRRQTSVAEPSTSSTAFNRNSSTNSSIFTYNGNPPPNKKASCAASLRSVHPISGTGVVSPSMHNTHVRLSYSGVLGRVSLNDGTLTLGFEVPPLEEDREEASSPTEEDLAAIGCHTFTCLSRDIVTVVPSGSGALTLVGPFEYATPSSSASVPETHLFKIVVEITPASAAQGLAYQIGERARTPAPNTPLRHTSASPSAMRPPTRSEARSTTSATRATSVTTRSSQGVLTPRATAIVAGGPNQSLVQGDHAHYDIGLRQYRAAPKIEFTTKRTPELIASMRVQQQQRGASLGPNVASSPAPHQPVGGGGGRRVPSPTVDTASKLRSLRDQRREELYAQLRSVGGAGAR